MVDAKYITNGIKVAGDGGEWQLRATPEGSWIASSGPPGAQEIRELGQGTEAAAQTLEAAGWGLARGEAERYEYESARISGDREEVVHRLLDWQVAAGALLPTEGIDFARQYETRQAAWAELGPDGQACLNEAISESEIAAGNWPDWEAQIAPEGHQTYVPSLNQSQHPETVPVLTSWLEEQDYEYFSVGSDPVHEIDSDELEP